MAFFFTCGSCREVPCVEDSHEADMIRHTYIHKPTRRLRERDGRLCIDLLLRLFSLITSISRHAVKIVGTSVLECAKDGKFDVLSKRPSIC